MVLDAGEANPKVLVAWFLGRACSLVPRYLTQWEGEMSPVAITRALIPLLCLLLNPLPKALLAYLPTMGARIVTGILGRCKGFYHT